VISKLANYTSPDELVAVVKKQNFRDMRLAGNEVKLVCCRDLPVTVGALFANKGELNVI
jgi:LMBR1 domain-containing protein 1